MRLSLRNVFVLYLALSIGIAPVAPAVAEMAKPAHGQTLPTLGSVATEKNTRSSSTPDWLLDAGTDQDLAPAALRNRSQGASEALSQVVGKLSSATGAAAQGWFAQQNMTAEVALKISPNGIKGGSLDVLVPFHDVGNSLAFAQFGMRRADTYTVDYRNTLNVGVGYRHQVADWLLGTNAFLDRDTTGNHNRLGVGAEAWTDFLKFSGNSYFPLSEWKKSPDRIDYSERPAKGWDVRAEGYLPHYPQLGGKLMYEQYYGEAVSLFSANRLEKNPNALTLSAVYNPVPMLGLTVNQRIGQGGHADTSAELSFNYRFGEPLARQVSTDNLRSRHVLANMRHDLVSRNNEMVMDNRKEVTQLRLPATLAVTESHSVQFTVSGASGLRSLSWIGDAAGFAQPYSGGPVGVINIPAYIPIASPYSAQPSEPNVYTLQAVGVDRNGREVASNPMTVVIRSIDLSVTASPATLEADGISTSVLTAHMHHEDGQPVAAGTLVNWKTSLGTLAATTSATDDAGQATVLLTSVRQLGTATVEASAGSAAAAALVAFTSGSPAFGEDGLELAAADSTIVADGITTTTLTASVVDAFGHPVAAGQSVAWTTSAGRLTQPTSLTDEDGKATAVLTSATRAGSATVVASIGVAQNSVSVAFVPGAPATGNDGLTLTSDTATALNTVTLHANVEDAHQNSVGAGVQVTWTTTAGTLSSAVTSTAADGSASVVLSAPPGTDMSAIVGARSGAAADRISVVFQSGVPALGSNGLSLAVDAMDASNIAVLSATVFDPFGDPVGAGEEVSWSTTAGVLAHTTTVTNASGVATNTLAGIQGSTAEVMAAIGDADETLTVTFTPGTPAGGNNGISLMASASTVPADGTSTSNIRATVRDARGQAVGAGVTVDWSVDLGTLSTASSVTDADGVARTVLTSATTSGIATVEVSSGAAHNDINIEYLAGPAAALRLSASRTAVVADGQTLSVLTAAVLDSNGNPVEAGQTVSWSTTAGTLSASSSVTNANGEATVTLTSATLAGTATITAQIAAADATLDVRFIPDTPATVNVTAADASLVANGTATTTLTASVLDANGNPVAAGVQVRWATSSGRVAAPSSTTNANGVATIVLTSSTVAGTATVDAWVGAARGATTVLYVAGPAARLTLTASPAIVPTLPTSSSTISGRVSDAHGNPLGAGITVNWRASAGGWAPAGDLSSPTSVTNAQGIATVVLNAGLISGNTTVTGSMGAITGTTTVGFSLRITLRASTTQVPRNGQATFTATVTTPDGTPVSGIVMEWEPSFAGQNMSLSEYMSVTDSQGVAQVVMTNTGRTTTYGFFSVWLSTNDSDFTNVTLL